jgi:hypothetical protein
MATPMLLNVYRLKRLLAHPLYRETTNPPLRPDSLGLSLALRIVLRVAEGEAPAAIATSETLPVHQIQIATPPPCRVIIHGGGSYSLSRMKCRNAPSRPAGNTPAALLPTRPRRLPGASEGGRCRPGLLLRRTSSAYRSIGSGPISCATFRHPHAVGIFREGYPAEVPAANPQNVFHEFGRFYSPMGDCPFTRTSSPKELTTTTHPRCNILNASPTLTEHCFPK